MKWDMEIDEVEAVLGKIWDLHDKLSDAIHSVSRAHFLNTVRNVKQKSDDSRKKQSGDSADENRTPGYVYVKDFGFYGESVQEAKSLNLIRTALENLEDQVEFFRVRILYCLIRQMYSTIHQFVCV